MEYRVKDLSSKDSGRKKIVWALDHMPVLSRVRENFEKEKPFEGMKIGACLHVTPETAALMITLKAGGAQVRLSASNPLSTKDDVAASLVEDFGIEVFAVHGDSADEYYENIKNVLEIEPVVTLDDGGDLTAYLHSKLPELAEEVWGGTEETTTGVIRFRAMEKDGVLKYPIIAVNDSKTKYLFDNRYGTGQSTIDGILRATNLLIAGSVFVVAGYGWCGRGVAMRARGMGARVVVTEVDPVRALEAAMDGFEVMPMSEAARIGDFFVTVTGDKNVISVEHIKLMKDGAILANSGHFDVEIDVAGLRELAIEVENVRPNTEKYTLPDGKKIYLLAEGRLVNLASAEGHPPTVMDMSFSNQALAVKFIKENREKLEKKVYTLPDEIDREIALLKLKSMNIEIDELTEEQREYLSSWQEGTH